MIKRMLLVVVATLLVELMAPVAAGGQAFDPALEASNYAKLKERTVYLTGTPAFQARLAQQNAADAVDFPLLLANDPERNPGGNVCAQRKNECAGDVRFYDWADLGHGITRPVLFTARSGATISGTVWATRAGPARRPGVVITTGSVQAPETLYWGLAAALAKAGYVVLTYDVQGQGRSDTFGETPDENEGFPSQGGQPFYDGTEDALDFLLSTSASPYVPRPSCGNANDDIATSHAAKQSRRVTAGLNAAFNPLGTMVDGDRIGIAGHSLGAGAVSSVGQRDPRVDAVVGWDNLGTGERGGPTCPSAPATRAPKTLDAATASTFKPALGMAADYGLIQTPNTRLPDAESRNGAFQAFKSAGVDSMQVNIRGGSHYEFALIPGNTAPDQLGNATLRGIDMVSWYTIAWFDKYVKGDPTADARLLTDRWRADGRTGEIDTNGDPNLFSFYLSSRYDLSLASGGRAICDDIRTGCPGMGPDGRPVPYGHHEFASTPDGAGPGDAGSRSDGSPGAGPIGGTQIGGRVGTTPGRAESDGRRARPCMPRSLRVTSRRIGAARLRGSMRRLQRRYRVASRGRRAVRFCVRGGGRFLVRARRGRIVFVASTARGHRTRRVGPGQRVRGRRIAGVRRARPAMLLGTRRGRGPGRLVYGTRDDRLRYLAVVPRRDAQRPLRLARQLRRLGLR